ncbi:cytosolic non-specific dipeptidase-like [Bradysia coprophila]|uniref:cytosolic non-specific dipeptidase-like n=1 Tax=Bradysia coprophila TaxID=38358 RepID=UPI00187DACED|nr:cytosolic non-specific dipeptidase-like [Bradysia coprophila]
MDSNLIKIFKYIDKYQEHMLDDLRKIISFKSISGSYEHQNEMQEMIRWTEARLKSLKPSYCERFDIGSHTFNGRTFKLPYVIFATFGNDPKKTTVLIHCGVDVKDSDLSGWTTDPWSLVKSNRDLVGRGVYKGKTQFISWLHILEAFRKQDLVLPVNFKFLIEGMSQMNSIGLEDLLWTERTRFFRDIDFICVNDMEWLNSTNPCIGFGCCGISQFELICTETRKDIDPFVMIDSVIKSISDDKGNISIPKFDDDV